MSSETNKKPMSKDQVIDYIKSCPIDQLSVSGVAVASGKTEATIKRHFSGYIDARLGKASKGSDFKLDDLMVELKAIRKELADLKKTVKIDPASWIYVKSMYGESLPRGAKVSLLYADDSISSVDWHSGCLPRVVTHVDEDGCEDFEYGKVKNGELVKIIAYKVMDNGS